MSEQTYLDDILNRVGKSTFIKYYYDFRTQDTSMIIRKMDEPFTDKSKRSRTSKAIRLFRENINLEALERIIASIRVDDITLQKAKEIYLFETKRN